MRPNDLQSSDDVRQIMGGIYRQLKKGADFAELARLQSQDPGSAVKGVFLRRLVVLLWLGLVERGHSFCAGGN